jgi:hypothetical protein
MKQVFLLFCLISILPVPRKNSTTEHINAVQPVALKTSTVDTNQLKQSDWYGAAMKNVAQSEYHIHQVENTNIYSSPNRRNNLRFKYDENGFSVEPRTIASWKVSFTLDKKQIGDGRWQVNGNQAEYITDNITVQYINNEEGMRQNFILQKPLSDDSNIKLRFSVQTKLAQRFSKDRLQFANKKSGIVLSYEQLKVWDANGKPLEAAFEKGNNDYCIHVNTQQASYPITIDPLSITPAAMIESNQVGAYLGYSVASAGDVNGDGFSDVIAGAFGYDNGETDEGAAFIYHGSASGISTTAAAMVERNLSGAWLGWSVASAGDVNRDGYSDVIVGAPFYTSGQSNEGAVFVYHGSASGINTTAATMVERNQAGAQLGFSVASAGDVNGDGYSDVVVGAPYYDNNAYVDEGGAFVYIGSPIGLSNTSVPLKCDQAGAQLGFSVAGAGDFDGDGYSDVVVGARNYTNVQAEEGAIFVYYGSGSGNYITTGARIESNQAGANMGWSVAGAGDVNGDGYSDVLVGVPSYENDQTREGAAFIYHGSSSGLNTAVVLKIEGNQAESSMGRSVASAGDINGDGYSDIIVGAPNYDNVEYDEGVAFVYHGSASGVSITAPIMLESNQTNSIFGYSVAAAGDVNGDGYSDIIVGAGYYNNGQGGEGAAFTYHGSPSGISLTTAVMIERNQAGATMGLSVAGAGDVNGDGYSDVIVGVRYYDGGQDNEGAAFVYHGSASGLNTASVTMIESNQVDANMGWSVAGAGDVNGDGYSDVIVGALYYDNIETDEGAAFIYHGSPSGISTIAAARVESNQLNAQMGRSVAGAGDVNGDGYSDVIVGAHYYDNIEAGEGAAFIYHGSAAGINTTAAVRLESNLPGANMGWSVASAGDVNGDTYSDVIVGAPFYSNDQGLEGAAYVYYGSASGIKTTAAAKVEGDVAGANMGASVAGAGDVNGDGYSDVVVGAPNSNGGSYTTEGVVFVCYGSPSGINTNLNFAPSMQSNQSGAQMGRSVAGAGDVNGDGYNDIVVGAPYYDDGEFDEGAISVHYGSPSGINVIGSMILSNQMTSYFGFSAACAGDVNGDGYSDIIVGAPYYDYGQVDEGAAFIYHGNNTGIGKRNNLTLYNTDLTTPLRRSNKGAPNFGAGLFAKSFLGRTKGKLVWETTVNYYYFNGLPITNSVFYTSQQSSYTDLGVTGTLLKNLVDKRVPSRYTKVRVRVKYDPVTALTGQVYGPWRYVSAQVAGLSLGALPVDLISFKAAWLQKGKTAQISFITENESAICCYEIEKSNDGIHFNKIGKVEALNTAIRHTYTFTDHAATSTKQYYRLKTIHINGDIEYSNIQLLQSNLATEIVVFPNPATNLLQLRLNNTYEKINVQIMNGAGQVVKQYTNLSAVNQLLQIPVSTLASGTYFLYLQSGSEKQVLQFAKE